jgi:hypothetical protein
MDRNTFPGMLPHARTYATWPVWSNSTSAEVRFQPMTSIPPEIRAALEEVLAYYTEDEERDFEAREDEDRTHHIYLSLRKIRQWLDETAA